MRHAFLLIMLLVSTLNTAHADTRIFGLVVKEPKINYTEGAQPIPSAEVVLTIGDAVITAVTDDDGFYEAFIDYVTAVDDTPDDGIRLYHNYPNPFNPATVIPFSISRTTAVTLTIYNILGQSVRTLAGGVHIPGTYRCVWDGRDDDGLSVSAGVYLYRLAAGGTVQAGKMLLLDGGGQSSPGALVPVAGKSASSSGYDCIMTIDHEGFVAWADTFLVYEGLAEGRKDVIMRWKGGLSDKYADKIGCKVIGIWGDFQGSGDDRVYSFYCDFKTNGGFLSIASYQSSYHHKFEEGYYTHVPWSHSTVDSVYVTITQSPIPERINKTIPLIIHFWGDMCPVMTNIDELSAGVISDEIVSFIYL